MTKETRWIDWNKLSLDQLADYLEKKYKYLSSGEALAIHKLVKFYRNNKSQLKPQEGEWISVKDRLPNKNDGDKNGDVLVWVKNQERTSKLYFEYVNEKVRDKNRFPYWQPLPTNPLKQ